MVEVEITDMNGKIVYNKQFTGNETFVDLSNENSGIFIIKVVNQGKTSFSRIALD
jgi:hypothetical protein